MRECQTNEDSNKVEKMSADMREIQMKYYTLKSKSQKISSQGSTCQLLPTVLTNQKKYCGGGFTMLVAPSRNCWSLESNSKEK